MHDPWWEDRWWAFRRIVFLVVLIGSTAALMFAAAVFVMVKVMEAAK